MYCGWSMEDIERAFDGARYVHVDNMNSVVYVWNGSLTVNIYDENAHNCDMFTMEGASAADVDVWDVRESIEEHVAQMEEEAYG